MLRAKFGNYFQIFRDNLSVSFSRMEQSILLELSFLCRWERYCPETSVTNYQPTPHSNPQERRPELHQGGRQKPRNDSIVIVVVYHYPYDWLRSNWNLFLYQQMLCLAYSIVYTVLDLSMTVTITLKLIAIQQNEINKDCLCYGSESRDE